MAADELIQDSGEPAIETEALSEAKKELSALREDTEKLGADLLTAQADVAAGEKALDKNREKLTSLEKERDALISELTSAADKNQDLNSLISSYAKKTDGEGETYASLLAEKEATERERADIRARIAELESKLPELSAEPAYREAVEEAACLVVAISEGSAAITETETRISNAEARLEVIKGDYAGNEEILYICQNEYDAVFGILGTDNRTEANMLLGYNELDREKQNLYRDQITGAAIMQDLAAIEKAIADNTDAMHSSADSKRALEGAKATLTEYAQKCSERTRKKIQELCVILGEKKFFEGLGALKYGDKCPVCSSPVSEQADCGKALAEILAREKATKSELDKLISIAAEYEKKLEKINVNLGFYESAEKSASNYLDGLKQNKLAKLSELKKILTENKVRSHEELTDKLEKAVDRLMKYGAAMSEVKAIGAKEEAALKSNEELGSRIEELINRTIPNAKEDLAQKIADVTAAEAEVARIRKEFIGDADPIALMQEMEAKHAREDSIQAEITELYKKKITVNEHLEELTAKIAECDPKSEVYVKDGKEMTYTEICVALSTENISSVLAKIKENEEKISEANREKDEITSALKEKQDAAASLNSELSAKTSKVEALEYCLNLLKK